MAAEMVFMAILLAGLVGSLGFASWALRLSLPRYKRRGWAKGAGLSPVAAVDPSGNPNLPGGR